MGLAGEKGEDRVPVWSLPISRQLCCAWLSQDIFSSVVGRKRKQCQTGDTVPKKKQREALRDKEFYIPYRPKDFESERG